MLEAMGAYFDRLGGGGSAGSISLSTHLSVGGASYEEISVTGAEAGAHSHQDRLQNSAQH